MQVGAISETVEATSAVAPVELATPSDSTIEGTQVRELSLGTRNFAQLVSLMLGVIDQTGVDELFPDTSGASGTITSISFSVNGMRNRSSNLSLATFPSIDAIAEFKVHFPRS